MKSRYRPILFLLLFLIIAAGIAAFVFRQPLSEYLSSQAAIEEATLPGRLTGVSAADALDVSLLSDPAFIKLKSQLVSFDFDNTCRRRANLPAGASSTALANCVVGNTSPFVGPEDNKN